MSLKISKRYSFLYFKPSKDLPDKTQIQFPLVLPLLTLTLPPSCPYICLPWLLRQANEAGVRTEV